MNEVMDRQSRGSYNSTVDSRWTTAGDADSQSGFQRPWWRRVFGAWQRRVFGG